MLAACRKDADVPDDTSEAAEVHVIVRCTSKSLTDRYSEDTELGGKDT